MAGTRTAIQVGAHVWGAPALVVAGNDPTAGGCFISSITASGGSPGNSLFSHYVSHNQGTPAADTSVAVSGYFRDGMTYRVFLEARSPTGVAISAAVFADGVELAILPNSFSNVDRALVDLGDVRIDLLEHTFNPGGGVLTLRLYGGPVHAGMLYLVPRPIIFDAKDHLDAGDGATVIAYPGTRSGDAVNAPAHDSSTGSLVGTGGQDAKVLQLTGITEPYAVPFFTAQNPGDGTALAPPGTFGDYNGYIGDGFQEMQVFLNGTVHSTLSMFEAFFNLWVLTLPFGPGDAHNIPNTETIIQGGTEGSDPVFEVVVPLTAGDLLQLASAGTIQDSNGVGPATHPHVFDLFGYGREIDDPVFTSSPGFSFPSTVSWDLSFSHPHPSLVTHYEVFIIDSSFSVVVPSHTVTSPIHTTRLPAGSNYRLLLLAVYADGSYGWNSYRFSVTSVPGTAVFRHQHKAG